MTLDAALVAVLIGLIGTEGAAIGWLMVRVGIIERRYRQARSVAFTERTKTWGLAQDIDQCLDEACVHHTSCPVPKRRHEVKELLRIRPNGQL